MIRMEDAEPPEALAVRPLRWRWPRASALRKMDGKPIGALDALRYALGNALIYAPLRNTLGFSRVRVAYTAGEAIGPDLFTFYRSIGINLKQLYGSTETAVFVCLQPDHEVRADTVGVPIDGVEIRVLDSGEILVRSPGLLKGYYKNPEATAEVLGDDGWYRTGDAGFLDASGHLKIIDRAKDVGPAARRRRAVRAEVRREQAEVLSLHQGGGGFRRRSRPRVRVPQHRHGSGRQLGREAQPAVRGLRRAGAEARGLRA